MGFLTNIFKKQRERDLEMFISELKSDKNKLEQENKELKEQLYQFLGNKNTEELKDKKDKQKLTKKEKSIYNIFKNNENITKKELSDKTKLQLQSIKVYISRIKNKGFEIEFKEDQY